MNEERIKALFTESIQTQISAIESLSEHIEDCVDLLVNSLLAGQRLFVCGSGASHMLAEHFARVMNIGYKIERPAFPVDALNHYAQAQVASLAQAGDLLLVFATRESDDSAIIETMETALSRNMIMIAITGQQNDMVSGLLGASDLELQIPSLNESRVLEQQLLISQCISELVENTIFPQEHD